MVMDSNVDLVLESLRKNGMRAVFVQSRDEVLDVVKGILKAGDTVACGGSVTLDECGIPLFLKNGDYNFLDQNQEGLSNEDKADIYNRSLTADVYFSSTNAVTYDGVLYNVDGRANRVAALTFGTKNVIIVAGVNKIVKDVDEAVDRVRRIAAPKNCVRLKKRTFCAEFGFCKALNNSKTDNNNQLYDGCDSPDKICRNFVFTGSQLQKDRITIILVNEPLGY